MKIFKNEKLIRRNGKIGEYSSLGGMVVLVIGAYLAFSGLFKPETVTLRNQIAMLGSMFLGIILAQIGNHFGLRYGKSPRPDEKLDTGLKGLHSDFNLFHYMAPASHVLVGPAGVWVMIPYHQRGKVEFRKRRWRLTGGGFLQGYLRFFGQEALGRPDLEAAAEANAVIKFLAKKLDPTEIPEVKAILVFPNDTVELDAAESTVPALRLKQLKDFMRQESKKHALANQEIDEIAQLLKG